MKKRSLLALIALIVACMMVFAACGGGADKEDEKKDDETTVSVEDSTEGVNNELNDPTPVVPDVPAEKTDAEKIADYVAANGSKIISEFEVGFTTSGMTCNSTVEAVGTGIVVKVCVNEIVDLTADQKKVMQDTFDQGASQFGAGFDDMKAEIPELTYIRFDICEKDGDLVASLNIDGSTVDAPDEYEDIIGTEKNEITYASYDEEAGVLDGFTFHYDDNGMVTKVVFEMVTNPEVTVSQDVIDAFEAAEEALEQLKGMGCNITVSYTIEESHYIEAVVTVSGEMEVALLSELLSGDFTGSSLTLEDARVAAMVQGYEEVDPEA